MQGKRGISPVIATTLLVLLAVVLGVLIFLWVRNLVSEKIQKDIGGNNQNIELVCPEVQFSVDISSSSITLSNTANVPIHGVQLIEESEGREKTIGQASILGSNAVFVGATQDLTEFDPANLIITSGNSYIVVPILLGTKASSSESIEYICDKEYGVQVTAS